MPAVPQMTYDPTADAVAIVLAPSVKGARVTRAAPAALRADFVGDQLVGLELLGASALLPTAALAALRPPIEELTMAEAVRESHRQPRTLRSAIAAGKLEATKRGRDWFIPRHALWNYLESLSLAGRPPANPRPRRERTARARKK